jgi:hypothetical protein
MKEYPNEFLPFGNLDKVFNDVLDNKIRFGILLSSIPEHFIFIRKVSNTIRIQEVNLIQLKNYVIFKKYGNYLEF